MEETKGKKIRKIQGTVISDKMNKTIVVVVQSYKTHPKYLKKYLYSKKYKVHDPENKHKNGDKVEFVQCRPMSKDKRFIIA